ncbi:MAG: nucleotidyltransferase family protein [Saprospiraceae bacterium]|nr:nucleotidyltransferase family protein [Saprospiraceae bacterium]
MNALLQQSLRLDDPQEAARTAAEMIRSQSVFWQEVMEAAIFHQVAPALHKLLHRLHEGAAPAEVLEQLQAVHLQTAHAQMAMVAEFRYIRKHLSAAGVDIIPFKGFWLAHSAYGNLADCDCADIDLFIRREDLTAVQSVMTDLGYVAPENQKRLSEDFLFKYYGDYSFDKMENGERLFHFEFHWSLGNFKYIMDLGLPQLQEQIIEMPFMGSSMQVFSPSANLLLAALHHGAKDAWLSLKQVQDIGQLLHRFGDHIDWPWILAEAKRLHAEKAVLTGVALAVELNRVTMPASLAPLLSAPNIRKLVQNRLHYLEKPPGFWRRGYYLNRFLFHLRSRNGLRVHTLMSWAFVKGIVLQKVRRLRPGS